MSSRERIKELFNIAEPYQPSLLFPSPYSLNNSLTKNGYSENAQFRHSDKAPDRNLDASASWLQPRTKKRSPLWNEQLVFYSENGEPLSGQPVSFALTNLQPLTSDPGLFYNSHLGTYNCSFRRTANRSTMDQFLCSFQPLTTDLYPRSFEAQILNRSISGWQN